MSLESFNKFHNQVFNLPRDSFSNFDILKIKSLAEYLYLIKDEFSENGLSLKEIYVKLHFGIIKNNVLHPNGDFLSLFNFNLLDEEQIKYVYDNDTGRQFRHWMELASLLELISNVEQGNNRSKRFLTIFCQELNIINKELLEPILRDKILSINTKFNSLIGNLNSYRYYKDLDFNPAYAILKYIYIIKRPCSKFELSVFFGRPDFNLKNQEEIINSAIVIGNHLNLDLNKQIDYFFRLNNWVDVNGNIYVYSTSQEPYFKFNSFFILMSFAGLIKSVKDDSWFTLTEFSESLMDSDNNFKSLELLALLDEVEKKSKIENLTQIIAKNRLKVLEDLIKDDKFLSKINLRAANKSGSKYIRKKTKRFKRDDLIREVSKQIANFNCQGCQKKTFLDANNNNFVESHHIIEYNSKEEGPDVLQNLLVLCPNCHSKIHFARLDIIEEFYNDLRERKILKLEQFIELHNKLGLLKKNHINILLNKKVINGDEAKILYNLIC